MASLPKRSSLKGISLNCPHYTLLIDTKDAADPVLCSSDWRSLLTLLLRRPVKVGWAWVSMGRSPGVVRSFHA